MRHEVWAWRCRRVREQFARDGAVLVRGLLDPAACTVVRAAIDSCRHAPSEHYAVLSRPGRPQVDSDLFRWFDVPALRDVLFNSALAQVAADLLDSREVVFVEDQWFASAPDADTRSPWHQDAPYYNIDGDFLTLWVALDDAPEAASLRVIPGSHRWGRTFAPVEFAESMATIGAPGELEPVPPTAEADAMANGWDVRAGDAIAMHPLLLHSAGAAAIRGRWFRRLSTRWAASSARYLDRGAQAASFWKMLPHGLRSGDPLACEVFPLIRPGENGAETGGPTPGSRRG